MSETKGFNKAGRQPTGMSAALLPLLDIQLCLKTRN
jgi:hypothetical protein